jgi:hypothetical protein
MPATIEDIGRALGPESPFNEDEKFIIKWQYGLLSDFESALIDVIKIADSENLNRLYRGFPKNVLAFRDWRDGDLGNRIRAWGLDI